ncbi:DUF5334 family protein [Methylobacterium sp. Leaf123]|uniref:DUF5334 family protein n=1 Tax=Methylobacterium sp. Leaf123 TaxID=1736264 RepID=UPI000B01BFEB|nr:DUF5334 family protein [Methylobacterium sp. Leaf123]
MMSRALQLRGKRSVCALIIALLPAQALGWDGTNSETGDSIEIGRGETVRRGRSIDYYDHGSGDYRSLDVDSVRRRGNSVEIEGTDDAGNSVTLEMDGE